MIGGGKWLGALMIGAGVVVLLSAAYRRRWVIPWGR